MSPLKKIPGILFVGLLILTACASAPETSVIATPAPQPTATAIKILPTPSIPGNSIQWGNLQVTLSQLEVTQDYVTEYDTTRIPPIGDKFLWVHVQLKNIGKVELNTPLLENYSILYAATELKPTYGHRKNYSEYTTLDAVIFPDHEVDGWLRFDIPATAESKDMRFVFLPESSHVGSSFSSPNYPYGGDKPTFVWNCTP
jgi:hypothetical protein